MKKKFTLVGYLNDDSLSNSINKYNLYFIKKIKEDTHLFTINLIFLNKLRKMDIDDNFSSIYTSVIRQKSLWTKIHDKIKTKELPKEYVQTINKSLKQTAQRGEHIYGIIKDLLYTTKYYPYFESQGFAKIENMEINWKNPFEDTSAIDSIFNECEKYIKNNKDIIEKHLEDTKEERISSEKYRQNIKDKIKAEKEQEFLDELERNQEVNEILMNEARHMKHKKDVEKSFEEYWS